MRNLMLLSLLALLAGPAVAGPLAAGGSACFELSSGAGQAFRGCAPIDGQGTFSYRSDVPFGDSGPDGFGVTSLTFGGHVDPNLTYSIAVVDLGTPSNFGFTFFTPIVPGPYTHAKASINTLINGADGTSVSINPLAPATKRQTPWRVRHSPGQTSVSMSAWPVPGRDWSRAQATQPRRSSHPLRTPVWRYRPSSSSPAEAIARR